jgi:YD repeat-containing protein
VKTQKMKWVKDKLVDDLTGKSSPGAVAFTEWFTTSYDAIAAEQYLVPPAESGITKPVPVFTELRRVALLTAIAEKLRDQSVPMPFWMRDYEVRKVPFEKTTPGMEVTRKQTSGNVVRTSRIFGGVELSAETRAVQTYSTIADAAKAPPETRDEVDRVVKLADRLEGAVADAASSVASAPLAMQRVTDDNRTYQAIPMPGAETLALGPCRLDEVDLEVPVAGGRDIRLVRSFNSFFNPKGPWGEGWALDLPRLQEIRVPVRREGNKSTYATCYELLTPLNSLYAKFRDVRLVPDLQNAKVQVPDQDGPFYGLANDRPKFLKDSETLLLLLKNGTRWHFTPQGDLVAVEDGPQVTVYERDGKGWVTRIVALLGGAQAAGVDLEYTSKGTLSRAVGTETGNPGSKPAEVTYTYTPSGRLASVSSAEGAVGYSYQGIWVASVTWTAKKSSAKPETLLTFAYNAQGQVLTEKQGESTLSHAFAASSGGGVEASVTTSEDDGRKSIMRYDRQMRPVEAIEADGTQTVWTYKPDGGTEKTVTTPDKRKVTVAETAGSRQRTVRADGEPEIKAQFDAVGRLTAMSEGGTTILEQEWQPDGQIAEVVTGPRAVFFQYTNGRLLSSLIEHPSAEKGKFRRWQETKLDRRGLPTHLTNFNGLDVSLTYDASGSLASALQKTPEGNMGYSIQRDDAGRIVAMKSSWGDTSYVYTKAGDLHRVETKRGKKSASVDLSGGLVRQVTGFDKGVTTFAYHDKGDMAGALSSVVCANGLKLVHRYDARGQLASVAVGTNRSVRLDYDAEGRIVAYTLEPLIP